jgi:NifU-like protein involved in Fe-S cluster formation
MMTKDDYRERIMDYFETPPRHFTGKIEENQEGRRSGNAVLWWHI